MALKIMQEVTEWKGIEYRQPNHVYLMSGDRAYAYVPWGKGQPYYFRTFQRLDRRGRKFVEVKQNRWRFRMDLEVETEPADQPTGKLWNVTGSKGNTYTVSLNNSIWSCTCPGFGFRNRCRHMEEIKQQSEKTAC